MTELIDEAAVDASLQLCFGTGRQIGHNPADFLADRPLRMMQSLQHSWEKAHIDELLCLIVRAGSKVTDGADDRNLDRQRLVINELNKACQKLRDHKVLNDVLGAIDDVAHGPAAVDKNVLILVRDERVRKRLDGLAQDFQFGPGLTAAEIRQRPGAVTGH